MLVKNLSGNRKFFGSQRLEPGQWEAIPDEVAHNWGLVGDPGIEIYPDTESKTVLIFSGCNLDTTGGGQHPAQIARALVAEGYKVIFAQPDDLDDEEKGILAIKAKTFFSKESLPESSKQQINALIAALPKGSVVLSCFPSSYTLEATYQAKKQGMKTAYWCLDDWEHLNTDNQSDYYLVETEKVLAQISDYRIATARVLKEKIERISNLQCAYIPNGFESSNFQADAIEKPKDLIEGLLTLVYWGELRGSWFDWSAIELLADRHPEYEINLIGPAPDPTHRVNRPNIHYLGEKPVSSLQAYGQHADAGLIPFKSNPLVWAVNPIKAYEYLKCGLPILAPPMPELQDFPNTYTYEEPVDLTDTLYSIQPFDEASAETFLSQATWTQRVRQFLELVNA